MTRKLAADEVDVWLYRMCPAQTLSPADLAVLSPAERERAGRFAFQYLQENFIRRRAFLRSVVATYDDLRPYTLTRVCRCGGAESHGRPLLLGKASPVFVSTSSVGTTAVVAIARAGPIGVDAETPARANSLADLPSQAFTPPERAWIRSLPSATVPSALAVLWTTKEAYSKYLGQGMDEDLSGVDARALVEEGGITVRRWTDVIVALAAPRTRSHQRWRVWPPSDASATTTTRS